VNALNLMNRTICGQKNGDTKEGVVIRKVGGFDNDQFPKNVAKLVRENHVQTDQHWTRNWKKAELIKEYGN